MTGNLLLVHAFLLFQVASSALAGQEAVPTASSRNPHGAMKITCEKCHSASAWTPIRPKPEFDHGKTGYPLRGLHTGVRCEECHVDPVFANVGRNRYCHPDLPTEAREVVAARE